MKQIEDKILSVIDKYRMLEVGDTVVVAVSGGADSMCLLHFFNKYLSKRNFNIICAHVNHGIRGTEALRDEEFVLNYCKDNNIKAAVAHFNIPEIAKSTGESEEQCGRRLRYEFFNSLSENAKIATAHNLNDSAETFLFNFARGTGLKGLTGIPPVRDNIIRPLSECTREEIEQYLCEEGVSYVTDSTNLSDEYSRNKIRHNIIPVFNELNPGFYGVFLNCTSVLADAENFLSRVTDDAFNKIYSEGEFSVSALLSLDKVILDRLLIKISEFYGAVDISFRHIQIIKALLKDGGAVTLPGNVTIASDKRKLYLSDKIQCEERIFEVFDKNKASYVFPECILTVERVDKNDLKNYNIKQLSLNNYADGEKLINSVFRSRNDGDRFRYPNAEHSKSLKNLFKEKNISPSDRRGIPMLADDEHILWISGVGVSEYAKVREDTKYVVKICKK